MTWVAVAVGGATLVSGIMGSNAASSAAQGAQNAANQANATSQQQYNQTRLDQLPWMQRGNAAGNQLAYLMGLPGYQSGGTPGTIGAGGQPIWTGPDGQVIWDPGVLGSSFGNLGGKITNMMTDVYGQAGAGQVDPSTGQRIGAPVNQQAAPGNAINTAMGGYGSLATPFSQTNWQVDPGYAFRLAEGQKALERSAAAKGMSLSGAQLKALTAYGQGMGSQEYGAAYGRYQNDQTNLFNRLSGIAGTGQQANQFVGQLGANMANTVGNNMMGAATASGNAAMANAGMWGNAINTGLNTWMNYNRLNSLGGGQPSSWSYSGMGG